MDRWALMLPARPLRVPGPLAIVLIPVAANRECHDRQPDPRTPAQDGHRPILVDIAQVLGVDPAAVRADADVAPVVIGQATLHLNRRVRHQPTNERIVPIRAGAQIDPAGRQRLLGYGRHGHSQCQ